MNSEAVDTSSTTDQQAGEVGCEMDKARFEEKFRFYLQKSEYSQAGLAQALGYDRSTVNKWIIGQNQVSIPTLYKICDLFELSEAERAEFFKLAGWEDYLKVRGDSLVDEVEKSALIPTRARNNPYTARATITTPDMFFGRADELGSIFARLSTLQSYSIIGQRRIGKSSLLYHLCRPEVVGSYISAPTKFVCTHFDLQTLGKPTQKRFFTLVLRKFAQAAGKQLRTDYQPTYDGFRTFIEDSHAIHWGLVLCLDEFEVICGRGEFDSDFFAFLRGLANSYSLAYVTTSCSGLHQLCHTGKVASSQFWNIFTALHLAGLKDSEARDLVTIPFSRSGMELSAKDVDFALELAGNHPLALQIVCYHLFEAKQNQPVDYAQVESKFQQEAAPYERYLQGSAQS